jgi:hypothetical protein
MSCLRVKCTVICISDREKDGETLHLGCIHDTVPLGRFSSQAGIRQELLLGEMAHDDGSGGGFESVSAAYVGRMAHQDPDPSAFLPNSLLLPFHFPTTSNLDLRAPRLIRGLKSVWERVWLGSGFCLQRKAETNLFSTAIAELCACARSNRCGGESLLIRKPQPSRKARSRSIGVVQVLADWLAFLLMSSAVTTYCARQPEHSYRDEANATLASEEETQYVTSYFDPLHMHSLAHARF